MKLEIRTTASPVLKSQPKNKKDDSRQLILSVRVYKNSTVLKRFNYYVTDKYSPVYVRRSELKNGVLVGENAIRYNSLLAFIKKSLDTIIKSELSTKAALNLQLVKDKVRDAVVFDFDLNFAGELNKNLIKIRTTGYKKGIDEIEVDPRVLNLLGKIDIPTEPKVDPLGQVELNDFDAGDLEDLSLRLQSQLEEEARQIKIKAIRTEERYRRNIYNKEDIFELFGSIYYDEKIPNTYDKIVIRLYEYLHYKNPQRHIKAYNHNWVTNFFKFLWVEGYASVSTQKFDPLNFDSAIFEGKARKKYNSDNLYKLFEIVKTLSRRFEKSGLLSPIDFTKVDLLAICGKKQDKKGKRRSQNLDITEFKTLFFFDFKKGEVKVYNEIFRKFYDKSTQKITAEDLATARDMFCVQVMAGGLRGYRELQTVKFLKDDDALAFHMKKVDVTMINPLNDFTRIVAERHGFKLPRLRFPNSENTLEHIYRALLKTIAEVIPLNRSITVKGQLTQLKDLFNPFFARKSFVQLMFDEYDFTIENISSFTGHVIENQHSKSALVNNYLDTQSPIKKRQLFERVFLSEKEITPNNKTSESISQQYRRLKGKQ
ncbi:MAG: hypothetical protein JNM57_06195 [Cyclobacteriaceae bacterium]|nr:hypothetical protein [Cyclobacteriaceae bacterium]